VLSYLGITRWRLQYEDPWLCFSKTTWADSILAKMAPYRIRRHDGDTNDPAHLHPTDADIRLQNRCHLCPRCHPHKLVTIPLCNIPKSSICRPDMRIHIYLFPVLDFLLLKHLPRIASMIQILIQICWLMKEHPLLVHYLLCGNAADFLFRRPELPVERTCKWWWALIGKYVNFIDHYYISICIIKEQCSDQEGSQWKQ